jgi:DNA-binding LytR/AlgR family response regulator
MQKCKPIRCLIADDEPPAREILQRYIKNVPGLQLIRQCSNTMQVLSFLQTEEVDLIFLDINMPQLKGNELLKILKNPPKVIITTAYAEYALEGYELDIVDYLLKPIQFDRFVKAVHKALQLNGYSFNQSVIQPEAKLQSSFVYFRADRKMVKVMLNDILYIESMKDYVKVVTVDGPLITKQSMTSVEAMLPENNFIRTHRSFLVSLSKIKSFTHEIIEIDKIEIPIGKIFRNAVLKMLN